MNGEQHNQKPVFRLVSISGGKDSTATLLCCIEQHGLENVRGVFADTGNEHEETYRYALEYLPKVTGCRIDVVRADLSQEIKTKRDNLARIAAGEPESAVYGKRKFKYLWTREAAEVALRHLHPTGNPFLDLCMVRGGFPSRKRQYCTECLKTTPLTEYAINLIDSGFAVESWQGVRANESAHRAQLTEREDVGGGLSIYRPILRWDVEMVFAKLREHGVEPNPLYKQGMRRVGCMPCINAGKGEVLQISRRFPEHIARIARWEALVSTCARPRSPVSFFHKRKTGKLGAGIHAAIEWSKTSRGGKQYDLVVAAADLPQCSSSYGLCE